jgi:DNA-binding GntR family transcriptional regulator
MATRHPLPKVPRPRDQKSPFRPDLDRYPSLAAFLQGDTSASTLVETVYDGILLRIIRGELASGTELKSTQVAAEMQVSRTPVVQAIARLLSDGIVTQQTHYRAVVRPGAENWLVDIHGLRQQIEPAAAEAAAGNVPGDVIDDLRRLSEDAQASSHDQWRTAARYFDYALHLSVAEFCGNLAVRESIRKCWMYKRVSYDAVADTDEAIRRGFEEHLRILQHLESGERASARRAMRQHLEKAARYRVHQRIV